MLCGPGWSLSRSCQVLQSFASLNSRYRNLRWSFQIWESKLIWDKFCLLHMAVYYFFQSKFAKQLCRETSILNIKHWVTVVSRNTDSGFRLCLQILPAACDFHAQHRREFQKASDTSWSPGRLLNQHSLGQPLDPHWASTPPQLAHRVKVQERCLSVSLIDVRGVAHGIEKSLLWRIKSSSA